MNSSAALVCYVIALAHSGSCDFVCLVCECACQSQHTQHTHTHDSASGTIVFRSRPAATHPRFGPLGATNGRPMPTMPQKTVKMMTGTMPMVSWWLSGGGDTKNSKYATDGRRENSGGQTTTRRRRQSIWASARRRKPEKTQTAKRHIT